MGAIHQLRVKSSYQLLEIEDIKIENKPNEHGYLYLKCLIDDSINFNLTIKASEEDRISVYEELEDEIKINDTNTVNINEVNEAISKRLFDGIVDNIMTSNMNGVYYVEIKAHTSSIELDIKEKSRSFQNADMTYDELMQSIFEDYGSNTYTQCVGQGQCIGKPLFQYKETDWNFIKRIASELGSEVFCDIVNSNNMFYFGRPFNASYEIEDIKYYKANKNLYRFREAGGYDAGHDTDYFYYEIEGRNQYNVGDEVYFKNKQLYVNQYSAYALKNEVIYKYKLCRKNGIWQTKLFNSLLAGVSLEGKVIDRQGEQVKLQLNIDENQNKDEAAWFKFAPPTGNMMYCMPVIGTDARLYFPNESSEEPIVTGCLRTNGSSCEKTSDTTKRYLGTEHGSEIEMIPDAINIKGGSSEPLNIKFEDGIGVTITSPKKLSLNADDEITIKTPKTVKISAQTQIAIFKTNTQSGMIMETDINLTSEKVTLSGTVEEPFPLFDDDEPQQGQKPAADHSELIGGLVIAGVILAAVALCVVAVVAPEAIAFVGEAALSAVGSVVDAVGGLMEVGAAAATGYAVANGAWSLGTDVAQQYVTHNNSWSGFNPVEAEGAFVSGVISGYFNAMPIGKVSEAVINGGIGYEQTRATGGSYWDAWEAAGVNAFAALWGGSGFKMSGNTAATATMILKDTWQGMAKSEFVSWVKTGYDKWCNDFKVETGKCIEDVGHWINNEL